MEFEITYCGDGNILNHYYEPESAWTFAYEFEEDEFEVLVEHFSEKTPDDDVSEMVEEYLPHLYEIIRYYLISDVRKEQYFSGKIEDLLDDLIKEYGIHPIDIIEADIKTNRFHPGCKKWNLLPEKELTAKWCDQFRNEVENNSFKNIDSFFEERTPTCRHVITFLSDMDIDIWFSQELYDEIKRRKTELKKS